jgi:hypothetical protein
MTEEQARKTLYQGTRDGLEAWIAGQPWMSTLDGGWDVESGCDDSLRFHVRPVAQGLRVTASYPGGIQMMGWLVAA